MSISGYDPNVNLLYTLLRFSNLLIPVFFYVGYSAVMFILKKRRIIIYIASCIVLVLSGLYFLSYKYFLFILSPAAEAIIGFIYGSIFRLFIDWFNKREERRALEKQNLKSELALLRSQINPHFLFNTLNNIDSLITRKSQTASESLIKLSDIMRYMIYDAADENVSFEKELQYIENYIDLEKLRLINSGAVDFRVEGNPDNISVAPMLFIPFVENAFKHSDFRNVNDRINIHFKVESTGIIFYCRNPYDKKETQKDETGGVGLAIVKQRLDLIYPGKHSLLIKNENNIFDVCLTINLYEN